jgi:excisionase family DNA binding protein
MEVVMNKEDLLTVSELATTLKVKESWVYGETRKTGAGSIPRLRVGKYLRFLLQDVLTWLKDKQNEG